MASILAYHIFNIVDSRRNYFLNLHSSGLRSNYGDIFQDALMVDQIQES